MDVPDREKGINKSPSRTLADESCGKKGILVRTPQEEAEKEAKWRTGKNAERKRKKRKIMLSEKIDSVLTHQVLGIPVLSLILLINQKAIEAPGDKKDDGNFGDEFGKGSRKPLPWLAIK